MLGGCEKLKIIFEVYMVLYYQLMTRVCDDSAFHMSIVENKLPLLSKVTWDMLEWSMTEIFKHSEIWLCMSICGHPPTPNRYEFL